MAMAVVAPCTVVPGGNGRGRVTVATRHLAPGEIVLTEHAVACVATAGRPLCDDCLTPTTCNAENNRAGGIVGNHRQCAGCRSLFGGSASRAPRRSSSPPCAVRLAAKLIFRRCSGSLGDHQAAGIDRLMHAKDEHQRVEPRDEGRTSRHEEDEEDSNEVARLVASMGVIADTSDTLDVVSKDRGETAVVPADALLDLARKELGRVSLNAINTCDGAGATGLGLFPEAAMFNHGCAPNCQAWWRGSKLEIRCTKPVAAGEELCFSYIPIDQPSAVRRAQLRGNWFFMCLCKRCASGQWDAELTGLKCPVASCSGAVPPPRGMDQTGGSGMPCSCDKCGSLHAARRGSAGQEARQGSPQGSPRGSATHASPPSGRGDTDLARPCRSRPDAGQQGRGGDANAMSPGPAAEEERLLANSSDGCEEEETLARAGAAFENGMEAYMREDPEVALVALAESLRARERILHPFNKELLRTLRYASYAAIATQRWAMAHSFLSRWLHPMETMFGAAEVWDVAAMRIDAGLVLDKLHATTIERLESVGTEEGVQSAASSAQSADGVNGAAACSELAEGLRWIWTCLGRDSGLPAETAALEVCARHGVRL